MRIGVMSIGLFFILANVMLINMTIVGATENNGDDIGDEYGNNIQIVGDSDESTGGRGVVTCEPSVNIAKVEKQKSVLIDNSTTSYTITDPDFGIYYIKVLGSENENDVVLRTEFLNSTSKCRKVIPDVPGKIYKNVNIWLGSPMIKGSLINFQVENSWFKENNVDKQNITIFQWNKIEGKWNNLQSNIIGEDDTYIYFEAITNGLSQFAITGITPETKLKITNGYPEDTYHKPLNPNKGLSRNTVIIGGIGLITVIALIIGFLLLKRRPKNIQKE